MAKINNTETTGFGKNVGREEHSYTVGENATGVVTLENSMKISQVKNRTVLWFSNVTTLLRIYYFLLTMYLPEEYRNTNLRDTYILDVYSSIINIAKL